MEIMVLSSFIEFCPATAVTVRHFIRSGTGTRKEKKTVGYSEVG